MATMLLEIILIAVIPITGVLLEIMPLVITITMGLEAIGILISTTTGVIMIMVLVVIKAEGTAIMLSEEEIDTFGGNKKPRA